MSRTQGLDLSNHHIDAGLHCSVRSTGVSATTPVSGCDPVLRHNATRRQRGLHTADPILWGGAYYSQDRKEARLHPLVVLLRRRYADSKPLQGTTR